MSFVRSDGGAVFEDDEEELLQYASIGADDAGTSSTGRVNIMPGENGTPFHMFSDAGKSLKETMASDALKGLEANNTSLLYLSPTNLEALQQGVRYQVYVQSQGAHVIGRQSDAELISIMRSIYLQHGRNTTMPDGSPDLQEVRRLNGIVIDYCVSRVLSEIDIYLQYRSDISAMPIPMDRGEFASSKGGRSLVQREF